jgi:hypothetical protein
VRCPFLQRRTDSPHLDRDRAVHRHILRQTAYLDNVVARGEGITLTGSEITVTVGLHKDDGAFSLAVVITADLPGVSPEQGEKLLQQAHQRCPYSKATRGNIDVQLTLGQSVGDAPG